METININTSGVSVLTKIVHIGKVRAVSIIENRPYKDVFELSKIPQLGEKRMKDIINQGIVKV